MSTLAVIGLAVTAMAIGWFMPVAAPASSRMRMSSAPVFVHPGAVTGEAARRLGAAEINTEVADVAAADTSIEVRNTEPPPPSSTMDIATQFRSELIAVIVEGGQPVALLKSGGSALRRASAGEAYRDGWRLHEIAADAIVIARRREERRIPVMGEPPGAMAAGVTDPGEAPRQRRVLSRQDARTRRP